MAAVGHVTMDGKQYRLRRPPVKSLANQMAPKISQGESEYSSLDTWDAWIQEDWSDGVGNVNPGKNGGVLYAEANTMVPSQIILPALVKQADLRTLADADADNRNTMTNITGSITLTTSTKLAIKFHTPVLTPVSYTTYYLWLFSRITSSDAVAGDIYTNVAGEPGALVSTGKVKGPAATDAAQMNYQWYGFDSTPAGLSSDTDYWMVIQPTVGTIEIATGDPGNKSSYLYYSAGAWAAGDKVNAAYIIGSWQMMYGFATPNAGSGFVRFNSKLYAYCNNKIFLYSTVNDSWSIASTTVDQTETVCAVAWGTKLYLGNGGDTTTDYNTMSTAETCTSTGVNGSIFAKHAGYLWRSYLNQVWYSADGSTWSGPFDVGDPGYEIIGMAGLNQNMYFATADGLYYLAPGDFVVGVGPWGSEDPSNGRQMVTFQGAIYVTVNGRLTRFTEDGSMQDVWMTKEADLVSGRLGKIWAITTSSNWLFVLVSPTTAGKFPTIWAYQGSQWHNVATLPAVDAETVAAYYDFDLFYDRITQRLWVITPAHVTYYVYVPDYALNPYNDTASLYSANGWVEWDWFWGNVREASKDFESVFVMGENFASGQWVKVYWQDDGSTGWELLGTCTADSTEIRWPVGTRPNTKKLKLGLLLGSTAGAETPRIRSVRVKYHTMVKDWYQWSLQVDVSGGQNGAPNQEMLNGERNAYTASQILGYLDTLSTQVPPFLYTDINGSQYQVKVKEASFNYDIVRYNEKSSAKEWEGTYSLVIEQVTQGVYSA